MALVTRLLSFRIERVDFAPFIEISEAPAASRGVTAAILHHHRRQHAASFPTGAFLTDKKLEHFFRDDGPVSIGPIPKPLHRRIVRVKVKNPICAGFYARGLGECREGARNNRAMQECPRAIALGIFDRSFVSVYGGRRRQRDEQGSDGNNPYDGEKT